MAWSKTKPTVPNFYWYREQGQKKLVSVFSEPSSKNLLQIGFHDAVLSMRLVENCEGEWWEEAVTPPPD